MDLLELLLQRTEARLARQHRLPESTYRLQFHAGFTFQDAIAIAPYLRELGITHCYASPYLKARPGSTHGYDVVDHNLINPEIGTNADYAAWLGALHDNHLRHILDIVPNHMGVATNENSWWNDVLKNGTASRYAGYFDIAWDDPPRPEMKGKVFLPVLGKSYEQALHDGEIRIEIEGGEAAARYFDRRFPLSRLTDRALLDRISKSGDGKQDSRLVEQILSQQHFQLAFWRRAAEEINYRRFFYVNDLAALRMEKPEVFADAHALVMRLLAEGKIGGLRIDHPDGLANPRQYLQRLQRGYAEACARIELEADAQFSQLDWNGVRDAIASRITILASKRIEERRENRPLYVVVEKILASDEPLRQDWPVDGTSGYDFLNVINSLFVDPAAGPELTRVYRDVIRDDIRVKELVYQCKIRILREALPADLLMLARRLERLKQTQTASGAFAFGQLLDGLREVIACFGIYRTFITSTEMQPADREAIEAAVNHAKRRNPAMPSGLFELIQDSLLPEVHQGSSTAASADQFDFIARFQQLTAPVTAKGVEDTAFYIYANLTSLDEVGGDPDCVGLAPQDAHAIFAARQRTWPYALSALSTHDTKRSEDVRARINVLSEIPLDWARQVKRWREINSPHRRELPGKTAPDANEEYFLYQTLLGAWPLKADRNAGEAFVKRIQAYMEKSLREAKAHTTWDDPNVQYEKAVSDFVAAILDAGRSGEFLADFIGFARRIGHHGLINSLSQTLVKLTAPGVPDTYQGTELWDLSLVDPDNRRPVDYETRRALLEELRTRFSSPGAHSLARELMEKKEDGRIKLFVTWRGLNARRERPGLYSDGDYQAVAVEGSHRDGVFAFLRRRGGAVALVVVPRLTTRLVAPPEMPVGDGVWGDTVVRLPGELNRRMLKNQFTGDPIATAGSEAGSIIPLAEIFADFPVALLVG